MRNAQRRRRPRDAGSAVLRQGQEWLEQVTDWVDDVFDNDDSEDIGEGFDVDKLLKGGGSMDLSNFPNLERTGSESATEEPAKSKDL